MKIGHPFELAYLQLRKLQVPFPCNRIYLREIEDHQIQN